MLGLYWSYIGATLGLYWDDGKENGNYYNGLYRGLGLVLGTAPPLSNRLY